MSSRTCHYCGEKFDVTTMYVGRWSYKIKRNGTEYIFCSYTCMNDYEKSDLCEIEKAEYAKRQKEKKKERELKCQMEKS